MPATVLIRGRPPVAIADSQLKTSVAPSKTATAAAAMAALIASGRETRGLTWPRGGVAVGAARAAAGPASPAALFATTQAAICARERKPSLPRICSTWLSAVRSEIKSRAAISRLVSPWATRSATSRSRRVRFGVAKCSPRSNWQRSVSGPSLRKKKPVSKPVPTSVLLGMRVARALPSLRSNRAAGFGNGDRRTPT